MLFRWRDKVFCTPAESTAFKYPLIDAPVTTSAQGTPVIEVPLDGTKYDLLTGAVIEWCPKTNPVRAVLGAIKGAVDPVPLRVYNTQVTDSGEVYVSLV